MVQEKYEGSIAMPRQSQEQNFNNWKFRVKILLEENRVWSVIESVVVEPETIFFLMDANVTNVIVQCLSDKYCKSSEIQGLYESHSWIQKYNPYIIRSFEHRKASHRLLELMRSYYEEGCVRIKYLNPMRFMYEESPYYEMGYIIGEIIERYRKVLEQVQSSVRFKFYLLFDILKKIEWVQKIYFELYHLVRMLHEIPRKWRGDAEFTNIESIAGPELLGIRAKKRTGPKDVTSKKKVKVQKMITKEELPEEILKVVQERVKEQQKFREKEKKRQKRKFKKMRQAYMKGLIKDYRGGDTKPFSKNFPTDYGWGADEDAF